MNISDTKAVNHDEISAELGLPQTKKNVILDATILSSLMSCARLTDFRSVSAGKLVWFISFPIF